MHIIKHTHKCWNIVTIPAEYLWRHKDNAVAAVITSTQLFLKKGYVLLRGPRVRVHYCEHHLILRNVILGKDRLHVFYTPRHIGSFASTLVGTELVQTESDQFEGSFELADYAGCLGI